MSKEEKIIAEGEVTEALPNTMFRVVIEGFQADGTPLEEEAESTEMICTLAGKMRRYRIRVLVGDKVKVQLDKYGGKGRIITRL